MGPKKGTETAGEKNTKRETKKGRVGYSSRPKAKEGGETDTERENFRKDGGEVMSCPTDKKKDSEGCSGSGLGGLTCTHCPSFLLSLGFV